MSTLGAGMRALRPLPRRAAAAAHPCTRCTSSRTTNLLARRGFSSSSSGGKRPRPSRIQWYPIPVGLGIGFLGLVQFYKVSTREREKQRRIENGEPEEGAGRPKAKLEGPW